MNDDIRDQIIEELESSQWQYAGELAETFGCTMEEAQAALQALERQGRVERRDCWPGEPEWSLAQ